MWIFLASLLQKFEAVRKRHKKKNPFKKVKILEFDYFFLKIPILFPPAK
jgi:hypothetical protein